MRTIIRDNYTPKLGDYHERIVQDSVNDKAWLFDCDGVFTPLEAAEVDGKIENLDKRTTENETAISELNTAMGEVEAVASAAEAAATEALSEVGGAVEKADEAKAAAEEASQKADSVEGKANEAITVANRAEGKVNTVQATADVALETANLAQATADEADLKVAGVEAAVNEAKESALEANTKADVNASAIATTDAALQAEVQARAEADATKVDKVAGKGLSTNDFTNADKDKLDSAIQPENIDYTVMTDLKMAATASTTSVVMEGDKVNLKEGTPSDFEIPLPVASSTQAGVLNTATYQTIQDNATKINAIEGGSVAITGISATPTQAALTSAWQTATGQTTLINGASILDVDNDLRWTYYTNTSTWYSASTGGTVSVSPFTNTEAGIIKGSNVDGQVHAETDGTGSVQGWDTVKADIANNASAIATKVDKETNKGLSTNDFTDALKTKLEGIEAGAEVNDPLYSTTGANTDGAMTQAATTNALDTKVDKETGKGLSTEDYTAVDKAKLEGIDAGAQVNRGLLTSTGLTKTSVGNDDTLSVDNTVVMYEEDTTPGTNNFLSVMMDYFYPVGSYYETSDELFDPNTEWGGTWVEDSAGRVLVAKDTGTFATVGGTGGEETHTLTVNEMPAHNHRLSYGTNTAQAGLRLTIAANDGPYTSGAPIENAGGGNAHNNLQPYVVIKRWHRTA